MTEPSLRILKDYHPPGTLPGSLPEGREPGETRVLLTRYDGDVFTSEPLTDLAELDRLGTGVAWVQIVGAGDVETIQRIADKLGLHPLTLEDALHRGQRPKIEEYEQHAFALFQHPTLENDHIDLTQIALFYNDNRVVSLQPRGTDVLASVRERLARNLGNIRSEAADYLVYAIMDFIVDSAFPVLEAYGERVEALENHIGLRPAERHSLRHIHRMRRNLLILRRALWPQRDIFAHLLRDDERRFSKNTRVYLRDLYDHAVQIIDVIETYRDIVANLSELYLSGLSLRMNDVMRTLTLISTVFMPLTFIVGLYGMNFDRSSPWNMPELGWKYGYLLVWGLIAVVAVAMVMFFYRKRWL